MGQRRSLAERRPFPGNSRWCSTWLNSRDVSGVDPKRGVVCSREDSRQHDVSSYTSGAAGGSGVIGILRLYQGSSTFCLYQVKSTFCLYQVKSTFCLYQGWCILTHTSVRGAASAWADDIRLSSDCDGTCVTAVVRGVVWEMTLAVAGWYRLSPIL